MTDEVSWEGQCCDAAWAFGLRCAELRKSNPYQQYYGGQMYGVETDLEFLINTLMTELWDQNFSQTEIRHAFESAVADMPRYARGLERRDQGPD